MIPRRLFSLLLLGLFGCIRPVPKLILPPTPIGDGGRIARELYRANWTPPSGDGDLIRVGLIPSHTSVRFRALAPMRIRAYSESESWEVASPEKVVWKAESGRAVRPAVVSHFATVRQVLLRPEESPSSSDLKLWQSRLFPTARWVGPQKDETGASRAPMERWFLALAHSYTRERAASLCARAKIFAPCHVVERVELPPIVEGVLTAENSTFSKPFRGFLELISPAGPVEVLDLETSTERYGPRLFVLPNLAGELTLLQSTSLANYLEAVVPSEIYSEAPPAALAAQAVVARTYALRSFHHGDMAKPFSICAGTACQVYRGVGLKRPGPSEAVRATADLVLREEQGGLAETFYHSMCGGHTESRKEVWGPADRGYLAGVSDALPEERSESLPTDEKVAAYLDAPAGAFCGVSTFTKEGRWRWSAEMDRNGLERLAAKLGLAFPLTDIVVKKRGASGRALAVEFRSGTDSKIVENELKIRQLFGGLLSSLFVLELTKTDSGIESVRIRGAGNGHGVGLCQIGAIGRAESGQTFEEILSAYYPGTQLAPVGTGVVP